MAKTDMPNEIQVLRFFEAGPIEKVEAVFNIVADKMRERLRGRDQSSEGSPQQSSPARRRPSRLRPEASASEAPEQTNATA